MQSAALLRSQIEHSLQSRIASALSPRAATRLPQIQCGVAALDNLLSGGLPIGAVSEFVGVECSGRTTIALAYAAALVQSGGVCAWVDASDSFDPESAAASGVDLQRLLWVRCGERKQTASNKMQEICVGPTRSAITDQPQRHTGGGSPHPRSEGRDMPQAIGSLLAAHGGLYDKQIRRERRSIGTPGAPNRPLTQHSEDREEQVNSDRLPPRRGDNLAIAPRCAEPQLRRLASQPSKDRLSPAMPRNTGNGESSRKPWSVLDQALRATDLLLQGGGFSAIILDLGGVSPEFAWRIPLATWFRFRAVCERTRVSLILLTQHPCARSSAEIVVRLNSGSLEADATVVKGIRYLAEMQRNRSHEAAAKIVSIRKPPQSEPAGAWRASSTWALSK